MVHRKGHVWTASKLEFLEKYLPVFTKIIGRNFPKNKKLYVDGYAGPGTNTIGGKIKLGSPLLAINASPAFDELYLVEKKLGLVQQLRQNIADMNLPPERQAQIHVQQGDFNVEVDSILRALPHIPTFFFLDPEGLELEWETVRKIGRRRADVFILISAGGVTRCAGNQLTHDSVTRFYGHERWRPIAEGVDPNHIIGQSKFEAFVELYLEGLRGLGFAHVERFLIAATIKNSQLHALVFAAKNDTAIKIAGQILERIQREQRKQDKGADPLLPLN